MQEEKETRARSLPPLTTHQVRTQQKVAVHKPARGLSPGIKSVGILILDFPASRIVKN